MDLSNIEIVEVEHYYKKSKNLLDEKEQAELHFTLSNRPKIGDLIKGTGGIRKLRWQSKGKGKSGGVRILYYFYNIKNPIFMLDIFSKDKKINITDEEKRILRKLVEQLKKDLK